MQARAIIGALMFAATTGLAGCAVDSDSAADEPNVSTAEDEIIVWCSDKSWLVNFYAEPEHINLVGTLRCTCFRPQTSTGTTSNFPTLVFERTCSLD
jgi:hypothetical protein